MEPSSSDARRTPLARVFGVFRIVLLVLVIGFLGHELWQERHVLGTTLRSVGWWTALAATVVAGLGGLPGFLGWRTLLAGMGTRLPGPVAVRLFFPSMLTRYLPGGIWPTVTHAAHARSIGESPLRLAGAFAASQGLSVVAALAVGLLALPNLATTHPVWWVVVPVLAAVAIPLAVPGSLTTLVGTARRLVGRRGVLPELPSQGVLLRVTGMMVVGWLVTGTHVSLLAVALGASPLAAATIGVGGFALSVLAGALTVVLPSGLGVREVVLGVTLAALVTGPALVTVIALSRVVTVIGDLASTAVIMTLARRKAAVPTRPE